MPASVLDVGLPDRADGLPPVLAPWDYVKVAKHEHEDVFQRDPSGWNVCPLKPCIKTGCRAGFDVEMWFAQVACVPMPREHRRSGWVVGIVPDQVVRIPMGRAPKRTVHRVLDH